jgi:hypothetical protein
VKWKIFSCFEPLIVIVNTDYCNTD